MATAVMDLISDDHRGLPGERMVRVEHLNLAPQTPGIMRSPRRKERNGWSVVVERRMPGTRDAGVVMVIVHPGEDLTVLTVDWMDWRPR